MRKNPVVRLLLAIMILVSAGYFGFRFYRSNKTKRVIEQTLAGEHWTQRMSLFKSQPDTTNEIIFLGNGLTEGFDLSVFNIPNMLNRGISDDFTEGVLKRLSEVTARKPKKIFLMIGINDILEKVPLNDICSNYERIIQQVKQETPGTKLYIQSALPVYLRKSGEAMGDAARPYTESWLTTTKSMNNTISEYNKRLEQLCSKYRLTFINLHPYFLQENVLKHEYTYDGIHLGEKGYRVWRQQVAPYVEE